MAYAAPTPKNSTRERADDRERIRRVADPIGFLAEVVRGKPVAVLDYEGHIVDYHRPSVDNRLTAAKELTKKLLPDLKAVSVDSEGGGIQITFQSPVPVPNSKQQQAIVDVSQLETAFKKIEEAVLENDDE